MSVVKVDYATQTAFGAYKCDHCKGCWSRMYALGSRASKGPWPTGCTQSTSNSLGAEGGVVPGLP